MRRDHDQGKQNDLDELNRGVIVAINVLRQGGLCAPLGLEQSDHNPAIRVAINSGSRLTGYEVVAHLGSGGMGEIWLGRDVQLDRVLALKVLRSDVTQDATRVARFRQETRAASALNHPNVCTIHALGEASDGEQFIAMEHIDGDTLRQRLTGSPSRLRRHSTLLSRLRRHSIAPTAPALSTAI